MGKKRTKVRKPEVTPGTPLTGKAASATQPELVAPLTRWWVVAAWYLAGAATMWAFGYTILISADLWWHLAAGDYMAAHGGFVYTDPWSYTFEGKPWLNDAWLADRIYNWWIAAFGLLSLAWWKWGLLVATYLLLMRTLQRVSGDLLSAYVGAVVAIAVGQAFFDLRPHLYSLLGFSVLLSLTLGRERPSWWLPLLFLVWVQLHAMFTFGLMALAVLLAPGLIWGSPEERRRSALLGATCVLVCLVNPNFMAVFTRPIRYALTSSPYLNLGEWQPPFAPGGISSPPYPFAIGVFLVGCVILLILQIPGKKKPAPLIGIALGALVLAMSLKSRRFVPLFGIAQSIVLASLLAPCVRAASVSLSTGVRRLCVQTQPVLALGLGLWWLWPFPQQSYAFHYMVGEDNFPVETANFIEQNHISGKVFSEYSWAAYLDLRTQGAMKVYIDGRADMVFDDETFQRYMSVVDMRPGWVEIIENSGAEYFLWPKKEIVQRLLATRRWRLLYQDYASALLERADRPRRQDLVPTPDTAWRELTLGGTAEDRNRFPESEAHYRRALELMPYHGAACFGLARVLGTQGRFDDAWRTTDRCERIYPYPARHDWLISYLDKLSARPRQ